MKRSFQIRILNRLRKHRKLMGYKQSDVAELLGLKNTNRLSRWEKGLSLPNTINLIKLSIIYRTFPNELYFDLLLKLRHDLLQKEKTFFQRRSSREKKLGKKKFR